MLRKLKKIAILLIITSFWIDPSLQIKRMTKRRILYNPMEYRFIKKYIISPSERLCQKSPLFIIMIVTSYVGDFELRDMFRKGMPREKLESMNTTRIFLLAEIPPGEKNITQNRIEEENENFHDILQGAFTESYRNLTIKHLMGLQWVTTKCPNASYILKVDDDTVFNFEKIFNILTKNTIKKDFLMGYVLKNAQPRRDNTNKWYVSLEEYPKKKYPTYVSGWYYVTTPAVAAKLINEAKYHPYFWVDDVLVTGILIGALNIRIIQMPDEFWFEYMLNFMIHTNNSILYNRDIIESFLVEYRV
ncbi:beta-1,3-galactosyltransferase 2-like [Cydia pomonella]|uniref:beta-1,3-galactosyltransferase 2-like n=1 Tax=Cydia pomonella TaxID=82600 RepID=UPI002ADD3D1E|nr:beta-1,3-galactosyltransferase 2-like [Cydia pomonella]